MVVPEVTVAMEVQVVALVAVLVAFRMLCMLLVFPRILFGGHGLYSLGQRAGYPGRSR